MTSTDELDHGSLSHAAAAPVVDSSPEGAPEDDVEGAIPAPVTVDPWSKQRLAMGALIRQQRELANLSLRQLSQATKVSNAYLSQIERGKHDPTVRVLLQIGSALHMSLEEMLQLAQEAGAAETSVVTVERAITSDAILSSEEKKALLAVYRSYVTAAQV